MQTEKYNEISGKILHAAITVHKEMGPGFMADRKLGLLINFNVPVIRQGFRRFVNNL